MDRALAASVAVYAALAAAEWFHAAWWLGRTDVLWCGNVVSDPFYLLANVGGPIALACVVGLASRCAWARRWPRSARAAIAAYAIATASLVAQGISLTTEYGLEIPIWWLP